MEAVRAFLTRIANFLKEYWQNQERGMRVRFIVLSGVALIGIVVAVVLLARVEYVVLFGSDVDPGDQANARDALTTLGIRSKLEDGQLLVDQNRYDDARAELLRQQIPSSGYTFDILVNNASGFGVSESERKSWQRMYIQETLNKELSENPKVSRARVEIAQPDNTYVLFEREVSPVTASVLLILIEPMESAEVDGVVGMVASAYPGLEPNNITVVDQNYNILNRGEPTDITQVTQQHDFELIVQSDFNRALLSVLQPLFGADYVRVTTNVTLDFDDKSTEKVTVTAPNEEDMEGLVVSMREIVEQAEGASTVAGEPGVYENGWDIPEYPETGNTGSSWSSTTREINYEINQQIDRIEEAKGKLVDLTASVVIDESVLENDNQNINNVRNIVAGALGLLNSDFDDNIYVSIMPLKGVAEDKAVLQQIQDEQRRRELFNLIRILVLYLVLGLCLALLIQRVYKFFRPGSPEDELLGMQMAEAEELDEYADLLKLASATAEDIEDVKSPERAKVEDFVERSPEMVANLLRNWLAEETPRGYR